jgi:hypothetical protein
MNIPADVEIIESCISPDMPSRLWELSAFQIRSKFFGVVQCVSPAKLFKSNWGKSPSMDLLGLLKSHGRGFGVYGIEFVE